MILDSNKINQNDLFDYTIIGSGIIGILLALDLSESKKKILLIDGGGLDNTDQVKNAYEGKIYGDNYYPLELSRQRTFGGGFNCWGGRLRNFDKWDLNNDYSNWPINYEELLKYKKKGLDYFIDGENKFLKDDDNINFKNNSNFKFHHYNWSNTYWDVHYEKILKSKYIFLLLKHSLIKMNTDGKKLTSIDISTNSMEKLKVNSKNYILACGGIENSRILLYNNIQNNNVLIKNEKVLGKYWMEHPESFSAEILFFKGISKYKNYFDKNNTLSLSMKDNIKYEKRLPNIAARTTISRFPKDDFKEKIRSLVCKSDGLKNFIEKRKGDLLCFSDLLVVMETLPDINNRIELSKNEKDIFGIPKINLFWKQNQIDYENHKNYLFEFAKFLIDNDLGRLKIKSFILDYETSSFYNTNYKNMSEWEKIYESTDLDEGFGYGYHHMGGTVCGKNSSEGIVDQNLKVFDQENLYIIGSSVFPSGGFANPTFPAALLALRLSNYLKENYV